MESRSTRLDGAIQTVGLGLFVDDAQSLVDYARDDPCLLHVLRFDRALSGLSAIRHALVEFLFAEHDGRHE